MYIVCEICIIMLFCIQVTNIHCYMYMYNTVHVYYTLIVIVIQQSISESELHVHVHVASAFKVLDNKPVKSNLYLGIR